jgi:hypothetical protein
VASWRPSISKSGVVNGHRGFKSHPLRQFRIQPWHRGTLSPRREARGVTPQEPCIDWHGYGVAIRTSSHQHETKPSRVNPGSTLAESILDMARVLGLRVIAEGVETAAQADYLRRRGCDSAQGYLFSRPIDAEAFAALLFERAPLPVVRAKAAIA